MSHLIYRRLKRGFFRATQILSHRDNALYQMAARRFAKGKKSEEGRKWART